MVVDLSPEMERTLSAMRVWPRVVKKIPGGPRRCCFGDSLRLPVA